MKLFFKKLIISLVISGIFFGFLEIITRLCLKHIYGEEGEYKLYSRFLPQHPGFVEDKYLFWKFSPNWKGERLGTSWNSNSFGLRDVEFPLHKAPHTFRILSLGESGTFGIGVELEQTYSKQLEKLLNEHNNSQRVHFQVINAGMPSYTSFQGLVYLKQYGLKFQPQLVMVYFVSSDDLPSYFVRISRPADFMDLFDYNLVGPGITDRQSYIRRRYFSWSLNILNKSAFYKILAGSVLRVKYFIYTQIKKDEFSLKERDKFQIFLRTKRVPEKDRRWVFSNLISLAKERSIKLLILIPPYVQYVYPHGYNPFSWIVCDKDTHILDLGVPFKNSGYTRQQLFIEGDYAHPSALGHKIESEAIYDYLVNFVFSGYDFINR